MPNVPGTIMPARSSLERPTPARQRRTEHPLIPTTAIDGDPVHPQQAPSSVSAIRAAIAEALRPLPPGTDLDPDALAGLAQRLHASMEYLLPIAEGKGLEKAIGAYLRRRVACGPPDAGDYPACTRTWLLDSARSCQMLLGLAVADTAAEHRHAGVGR
ncbi:hypothetical protein [Streptomyces mobaraensis]|uniref:Uncharacterized protein n=1 Tax=Streptomyces mobaraensis TaxID=35621 RepID=A0A5N5W1M4_STRMB|nr:hypothetical protein [Streptomyces mobaraensis]KAB7835779.1 hypothetical protein FRZ00_26560 [Streptomyces mobaraensis]